MIAQEGGLGYLKYLEKAVGGYGDPPGWARTRKQGKVWRRTRLREGKTGRVCLMGVLINHGSICNYFFLENGV